MFFVAKTLKIKRDFSCGGVVWDGQNEQILMVKVENLSGSRVWTFPKGHPDGQESDEQAALREVREETGWECEIVDPIMDVHYFYVSKGTKFNKTVRWFLMAPKKQVGTFDPKEILETKWMSLEESKKNSTYDTDRKLLKRVALLV
jgi:8-oxo-dGTP pyrophosphatase MutT (NUDIX family)